MKTTIKILTLIITTTILLNPLTAKAQCHIDDWKALKALYDSTDGDNWINNSGWEEVRGKKPTTNCDLENLHGIEYIYNGRIGFLNLSFNQLNGSIPAELENLNKLTTLDLSYNQLNGGIPLEISNLSSLRNININNNDLSGCYPNNLSTICKQLHLSIFLGYSNISDGNNFDASWEDFCDINAGNCVSNNNNINVATNYSGNVSVSLTFQNNQYILKNDYATVYDYGMCPDYQKLKNCTPVMGIDNLAANEALWAVTKAAKYFSNFHSIEIPPVNILVNNTEQPNNAKYNIKNNVIVLGGGDGIERNSMAAPDIIAHEYTHAIINSINPLGNYGISGALNESYADIFGEMVEYYCYGYNDWIWGGQIMVDRFGNYKGLRNLSNPKDTTMKYQLPIKYKEGPWIFINDTCFNFDNCGIHTNGGVHSYWFYLFASSDDIGNSYSEGYRANLLFAALVAFDNLINQLNPLSTYNDTREGSIFLLEKLDLGDYNEDGLSNIAWEAIPIAWDSVGVYNIEDKENPLKFRIANAVQKGMPTIEDGKKLIPVAFDLSIDSLGLDLTADELCFNLHLPDTYLELDIETIYEPLTIDELTIKKTTGEVNICINRLTEGAAKKGVAYSKTVSHNPILNCKVFILSEEADEADVIIEPMQISGYTKISSNEVISFKSATLPFSFDYNEENSGEPQNSLEISSQLHHKNCQTLGAIEIEVLNNFLMNVPPYTYTLKEISGAIQDHNKVSESTIHTFYNLEEGEYELEVKDSNTNIIGMANKRFSIDFVAEQAGSLCCAENLTIPPGIINGTFNTNGNISFSEGTFITNGTFEICE